MSSRIRSQGKYPLERWRDEGKARKERTWAVLGGCGALSTKCEKDIHSIKRKLSCFPRREE